LIALVFLRDSTLGNSLLLLSQVTTPLAAGTVCEQWRAVKPLDTSVVVKNFRDPAAVVNKLVEYEELYLG
jgi:hypothetical protein